MRSVHCALKAHAFLWQYSGAAERDGCPPDPSEIAESYLLGHLSVAESYSFEEHFMTCLECQAVLEGIEAYVRAMKRACFDWQRAVQPLGASFELASSLDSRDNEVPGAAQCVVRADRILRIFRLRLH